MLYIFLIFLSSSVTTALSPSTVHQCVPTTYPRPFDIQPEPGCASINLAAKNSCQYYWSERPDGVLTNVLNNLTFQQDCICNANFCDTCPECEPIASDHRSSTRRSSPISLSTDLTTSSTPPSLIGRQQIRLPCYTPSYLAALSSAYCSGGPATKPIDSFIDYYMAWTPQEEGHWKTLHSGDILGHLCRHVDTEFCSGTDMPAGTGNGALATRRSTGLAEKIGVGEGIGSVRWVVVVVVQIVGVVLVGA